MLVATVGAAAAELSMLVAQRVDVGGTDAEIGSPSGVIEEFLESIGWAYPILSAAGAILFVFLIVKFVFDRRNPQAAGGGRVGSVLRRLLALAIFFRPSLIGLVADVALGIVNRFADWITTLLG